MRRPAGIARALLALLLIASPAAARQQPPDAPDRHLHLIGGARALSGGSHAYGGLDGSLGGGRWVAAGQVLLGGGNGYSSRFFWGGPGYRLQATERLQVRLTVGGGLYHEALSPTDQARSTWVATAGGLVEAPVGPVRLQAGATALLGSYGGDDVSFAIPARTVLFFVGFGR